MSISFECGKHSTNNSMKFLICLSSRVTYAKRTCKLKGTHCIQMNKNTALKQILVKKLVSAFVP